MNAVTYTYIYKYYIQGLLVSALDRAQYNIKRY